MCKSKNIYTYYIHNNKAIYKKYLIINKFIIYTIKMYWIQNIQIGMKLS